MASQLLALQLDEANAGRHKRTEGEGAIALLPTVATISLALATGLLTDEVNTSPARLKGG
jgi:hypothetical protein